MRFSEGRISQFSHGILTILREEGLIEEQHKRYVLAEIKRVFFSQHEMESRIDDIVRAKIDSLGRGVPPGSREWDVLYRKYFAEEERKLRR